MDQEHGGSPWRGHHGKAWQPTGTGTAPAPGVGHIPEDGHGLRLGQDMGLWVGLAQRGPMGGQGRAVGS